MAEKDDILALISAMRAETEESSLTPDRVGYLLQRMVQLLDGYADNVTVGVIRQDLERALREMEALAAAEVYCTEAEYNQMIDSGSIDPNIKYLIYES